MATSTRAAIERVKDGDADYPDGGRLMARMAAVVDAQRAVAAREAGARWGLRSALVDLAAAAEATAAELPAPTIER